MTCSIEEIAKIRYNSLSYFYVPEGKKHMKKFWVIAILALVVVLAPACTQNEVTETKTPAKSPLATATVAPTSTIPPTNAPSATPEGGSYYIQLPEMYVQGFQSHWMNVFVGENQIQGGIAFVFEVEVKVDSDLNPIETSLLLQEIWATDSSQFYPNMGLVTIEVLSPMLLVGAGSRVEFTDGTILLIPEVTLPAGTHTFTTGEIWVYPMDNQGTPLKQDQRAFQA